MTKSEVFEILHTINAAYSRFEVTDDRVVLWSEMLQGMDFEKVMNRLKQHIKERPFPPTIAEISVYSAPKNDFLERHAQWLQEGAERIERDKQQ